MKYIINTCYGGFSLSQKVIPYLITHRNWEEGKHYKTTTYTTSKGTNTCQTFLVNQRTDSDIIWCVEELRGEANGMHASLCVVDIPDDYYEYEAYRIDEYDGCETLILNDDRYRLMKILNLIEKSIEKYSSNIEIINVLKEIIDN